MENKDCLVDCIENHVNNTRMEVLKNQEGSKFLIYDLSSGKLQNQWDIPSSVRPTVGAAWSWSKQQKTVSKEPAPELAM